MKRFKLLLSALLFANVNFSQAQPWSTIAPTTALTGAFTAVQGSSSTYGALKIKSPTGSVEVGSQNASWCHFLTDRDRFYFQKPVFVNGGVFTSFSNANLTLGTGVYNTTNYTPCITILNHSSFSDDGFVGIGTTSPQAKLHVYGDLMLGYSATGNRWLLDASTSLNNPNGDLNLLPANSSGVPNYTKGLKIEQTTGNFAFSSLQENANDNSKKVNIGSASGSTLSYGTGYLGFNMKRTPSSQNWLTQSDGANNGSSVMWSDINGMLHFACLKSTGASTQNPSDLFVKDHTVMTMDWYNSSPQVSIGKGLTGGPHVNYALAVSGKLVAKEIYVTATDWADYVFAKEYKLKSLNELEKYIEENKHLPNVPTTSEILETGINSAETDRILLEKIEELTLYIIQQNKRIGELEKNQKK